MQHVEFFHRDHFEDHYHRRKAKKSLSRFIDFFWETDFDQLYTQYPGGFSDALFPNLGYTYLINLGTPFVMQLEETCFEMKSDGFLPRHLPMICHHTPGNRIFGIKFRVSPVVFEKKVNFSEYREYIFPLAYLMDRKILGKIKSAGGFEERMKLVSDHYENLLASYSGSLQPVEVVTEILKDCYDHNRFDLSIENLAAAHGISSRTLQRYFEATTSINCKQALQLLRIRKAISALTTEGGGFDFRDYGYYDYSHFYRHLKAFVSRPGLELVRPHLQLLRGTTGAGEDVSPHTVLQKKRKRKISGADAPGNI